MARTCAALTERFPTTPFGDDPTLDEQAGPWMTTDLEPVTRCFSHLPDDEPRGLLRRICLRLLPD
ncbi:MAG: hypothetical protein ABS81_18010 [Pseudonocardia sp. SCN 72-86]|nr:MAG: hypothetical protein ABS81_18010 [Pseudonocardia sp. SCN 72-86]